MNRFLFWYVALKRWFLCSCSAAILLCLLFGTAIHATAQGISTGDGTWVWQNPLPQGNTLNAVWGADANHVWAVGNGGAILHWNGAAWAAQNSGTTSSLQGIWGSDAANIWAVGGSNGTGDGTILKWDGSTWQPQNTGAAGWLYGVWGLDANHVWAVGERGTILMWDGTTWTAQRSGTPEELRGIWAADANNVWAAGVNTDTWNGTILKWDGTAWTVQNSGTTQGLNGVWGAGPRIMSGPLVATLRHGLGKHWC